MIGQGYLQKMSSYVKIVEGNLRSAFVFIKGHFASLPQPRFSTVLQSNHHLLLASEAALRCSMEK